MSWYPSTSSPDDILTLSKIMTAVVPHLLKHISASSSASISIPAFAGWWNWLKVNVTPKPSSCCQFSPRPLSYHPATPETELHRFPWIFPLLNILNLHYFPKVFPGYFEHFKLYQLPEYIKDVKDTPVSFFYFLNILNIWKLRYIPQIFPISWHRCYCQPQPLENISRIELLANWSILNLALSFFETWNSGWWRFEANQPGNVPDYQVGQ